jgi:hypothetical protein
MTSATTTAAARPFPHVADTDAAAARLTARRDELIARRDELAARIAAAHQEGAAAIVAGESGAKLAQRAAADRQETAMIADALGILDAQRAAAERDRQLAHIGETWRQAAAAARATAEYLRAAAPHRAALAALEAVPIEQITLPSLLGRTAYGLRLESHAERATENFCQRYHPGDEAQQPRLLDAGRALVAAGESGAEPAE